MNDDLYMVSSDTVISDDVLLADETNVIKTVHPDTECVDVPATKSLPVAGTPADLSIFDKVVLLIIGILVVWIILTSSMPVNAAENNVYVDENYMSTEFGEYAYRVIVTNGQGSYLTLFSDSEITYMSSSNSLWYETGTYQCGFVTMKIENDYLVVDSEGASNIQASYIGNSFSNLGVDSTYNQIVYSNNDVCDSYYSNSGKFTITDDVVFLKANSLTSKSEGDSADSLTNIVVDCGFTDEKINENLATINTNIVAKLDIIIMLLIVMIALKMFSPLANNHKRGLKRGEK